MRLLQPFCGEMLAERGMCRLLCLAAGQIGLCICGSADHPDCQAVRQRNIVAEIIRPEPCAERFARKCRICRPDLAALRRCPQEIFLPADRAAVFGIIRILLHRDLHIGDLRQRVLRHRAIPVKPVVRARQNAVIGLRISIECAELQIENAVCAELSGTESDLPIGIRINPAEQDIMVLEPFCIQIIRHCELRIAVRECVNERLRILHAADDLCHALRRNGDLRAVRAGEPAASNQRDSVFRLPCHPQFLRAGHHPVEIFLRGFEIQLELCAALRGRCIRITGRAPVFPDIIGKPADIVCRKIKADRFDIRQAVLRHLAVIINTPILIRLAVTPETLRRILQQQIGE